MSNYVPSGLSKSLFQQMIVFLIPGMMITAPFLFWIYLELIKNAKFEGFLRFCEIHSGFVYLAGTVISCVFGFLLEDLGAWIESKLDIQCEIDENEWYKYLFDKCGDDNLRTYHKYVDSFIFTYKMELSMIPATIILAFELALIYWNKDNVLSCEFFYGFLFISLLIVLFLYWQAKSSCKYLGELRKKYNSFRYNELNSGG